MLEPTVEKRKKKKKKPYELTERKSDRKKTICICPICGATHEKSINWQGNGIPRINCRKHRRVA